MNAYVIGADILGATATDYATIRSVQARLAQLGYPVKQTGVLDKATDDALFRFAGKRGMPDAATMAKLSAPTYGYDQGPMSPEQLAKLDRALTPAEQAVVTAWQSREADTMLETERAKGGPQSETVSVTPQGATIRAQPSPSVFAPAPASSPTPVPSESPRSFPWKIVTGIAGGALALAMGAVLIFRRPSSPRHA